MSGFYDGLGRVVCFAALMAGIMYVKAQLKPAPAPLLVPSYQFKMPEFKPAKLDPPLIGGPGLFDPMLRFDPLTGKMMPESRKRLGDPLLLPKLPEPALDQPRLP